MEKLNRVHLGAGDKYWPGFCNIDCIGDQDIISDVCLLPTIKDGSIDEIHAIHVFEHLGRLTILDTLKEWRRILRPDGLLVLEMPSMDKIASLIIGGATNPQLTMYGIFGDITHGSIKMRHQWCYTDSELSGLLTKAGFDAVFETPVFHISIRDLRVTCRSRV